MLKRQSSIKRSHTIGLIWRWALAVVLVAFSLMPLLWMISAAINPVNDLAGKIDSENWV